MRQNEQRSAFLLGDNLYRLGFIEFLRNPTRSESMIVDQFITDRTLKAHGYQKMMFYDIPSPQLAPNLHKMKQPTFVILVWEGEQRQQQTVNALMAAWQKYKKNCKYYLASVTKTESQLQQSLKMLQFPHTMGLMSLAGDQNLSRSKALDELCIRKEQQYSTSIAIQIQPDINLTGQQNESRRSRREQNDPEHKEGSFCCDCSLM